MQQLISVDETIKLCSSIGTWHCKTAANTLLDNLQKYYGSNIVELKIIEDENDENQGKISDLSPKVIQVTKNQHSVALVNVRENYWLCCHAWEKYFTMTQWLQKLQKYDMLTFYQGQIAHIVQLQDSFQRGVQKWLTNKEFLSSFGNDQQDIKKMLGGLRTFPSFENTNYSLIL